MQDKYIGKLLDNRYEILQVIGTGGMAVVYKALCHRLNRYVAVKILKDEFAKDEEFRTRFREESHAVAMLSHPNIVSVYDVSRSNSIEYIVMELMDGMTLKQYIDRRGILSQKESIHFVTQILKGLSHAHSKGIIHRDIKPHNIMLLRDSTVKVADFGIARLESSQRTITREAFGSVHYIAPEQAKGSHIDCRADIYSTGVVLYEMLTGRLPYEGDTPVSVAIQHINSLPLSPREINPEIPEALERITMKAMSSNLSKRYASTDEMLADLEEFRKNPNANIAQAPGDKISQQQTEETKKIPILSSEEEPEEEAIPANPLKTKIPIIAAIVAVAVFITGIFVLISVFKNDDSDVQGTYVPDVLGMTLDEAKDEYKNLRFEVDKEVSKYSDEYEKGQIIEQVPESGERVTTGKIYVVLSLGPKDAEVKLANLYKRDKAWAEEYFEENGLKYRFIDEVSSEIKEEGIVIRTIPEAGEMVSADMEVSVYVSAGESEVEEVEVPDVSNKEKNAAITELKLSKLDKQRIIEVASDDIEEGYVIKTEPAADSMVSPDNEITVFVSTGPAKQEIRLPDITDKTKSEATDLLEQNKLEKYKFVEVNSDSVKKGYVTQTDPAAGSKVYSDTMITVYISKGPKSEPVNTDSENEDSGESSESENTETTAKEIVKSFRLPQDKESFVVKITVDDVVQYSKTHTASDGTVDVTLKGNGTAVVRMYVDDEIQLEAMVDF